MKNDRYSQRKALLDRYFTMKEVSTIAQADEAQIKSWVEADCLHHEAIGQRQLPVHPHVDAWKLKMRARKIDGSF